VHKEKCVHCHHIIVNRSVTCCSLDILGAIRSPFPRRPNMYEELTYHFWRRNQWMQASESIEPSETPLFISSASWPTTSPALKTTSLDRKWLRQIGTPYNDVERQSSLHRLQLLTHLRLRSEEKYSQRSRSSRRGIGSTRNKVDERYRILKFWRLVCCIRRWLRPRRALHGESINLQ